MATTKNVDNNMFSSLMSTRDLSKFTLMRGVTDYANLEAYNLYESSYSFLVLVQVPEFMKKLCDQNSEYKKMFDTYCHILEYDFRGLSGIDNITAETGELTNGISNVEIINKVTMQAASSFTMRYFERHGSVITRTHELFLRGIKDPRTQVKHYNGLIPKGLMEPGYENEVFSFMYLVCDNTLMNLEKCIYIVAAQPTGAQWDIYNSEKGSIEFKELDVEFKGYPIVGRKINEKGKEFLDWIRQNTTWDEMEFNYSGVDNMTPYKKDIVNSSSNTASFTSTNKSTMTSI